MDIVGREHIVRHIALININMCPLPALCLITGDGVCKLDLQGIIVFVFLDGLHPVSLQRNVRIVFFYLLEEFFALLMSQGWSLSGQGIEQYRGRQFIIIIVRKKQRGIGKMEAIEFVDITHSHHPTAVAVGNEGKSLSLPLSRRDGSF